MTGTVAVGRPLVRGRLALFPLLGDDCRGGDYLPGPEAMPGLLDVAECDDGASVGHLVVGNRAPQPVLLLEGETVLGAKQNRTLNVSVLLASGTRTVVPVSCVEAGRWGSAAAAEHSPYHAPSGVRAAKVASVAAKVQAGAGGRDGRASDQGQVWRDVDRYADRLRAGGPTRALEDVQHARAGDVAGLVAGTTPLRRQRGVAVAAGNRVLGFDLFDRHTTLAAYWSSLLAGYALDALMADHSGGPPDSIEVDGLVAAVRAAPATRAAATGLGRERHVLTDCLAATALEWEERVVHLAAFVLRPGSNSGGVRPIRRHWFGPGRGF